MRLFRASGLGDLREVTALIAEGADVNWADVEQNRGTPLIAASQGGHLAVVNALIAARAAVDRSNSQGFTALIVAAQNGFDAIVDCLIRVAGASVHHVNDQGSTALHIAAQQGRLGVVRILLRAGANPNVESTDGERVTPLYLASKDGHLAVVEALIEAGANVNHIACHGFTSLIASASCGHLDIVRALLAAGADPRFAVTMAGPANGKTALDAAKEGNHPAIAALLEARLAELAAAGST
jgi:ankyrin repeat protein